MSVTVTKEKILDILKTITYPGFSRDIVSFGMVKEVEQNGKMWEIHLKVTTADPTIPDQLEDAIRPALASKLSLNDVHISTELTPPRQAGGHAQKQAQQPASRLAGVKHKIAVASGKGGVGKSTVACNLAVALARKGYAVGLFDSDIYGPSVPLMMGVNGQKPMVADEKLQPIERYGIKIMSIGFFIKDDDPVIWRGPMVMKAIEQFLTDVNWGELDYLIVDLPPGTGDAQLSLSQLLVMDGAVIVTTPQDVALLDAIKGVLMFKRVNVPIIGIVENMSYYECPQCHHRAEIFSHGGARRECEKVGAPFIGEIPLHLNIRKGGDEGEPITYSEPDSAEAKAFDLVAAAVIAGMGQQQDIKISI